MTDSEAFPGVSHREAAGWVLGTLDPHEVGRFKGYLESCAQCQVWPVAPWLVMISPGAPTFRE